MRHGGSPATDLQLTPVTRHRRVEAFPANNKTNFGRFRPGTVRQVEYSRVERARLEFIVLGQK